MASLAGTRKPKPSDIQSEKKTKSRVVVPSLEEKTCCGQRGQTFDSLSTRLGNRSESIPVFPMLQGGGVNHPALPPYVPEFRYNLGATDLRKVLWSTSLSLVPIPEVIVA